MFLSLICNLQFNMFLGGIYLVINDIPIILCLLSVKWNICLTDFSLKKFVPSLELVEVIIESVNSLLKLCLVQWLFY